MPGTGKAAARERGCRVWDRCSQTPTPVGSPRSGARRVAGKGPRDVGGKLARETKWSRIGNANKRTRQRKATQQGG